MATHRSSPAAPEAGDLPGTESFSQFVARVLDQLSLSAWLPSAALVSSVIFLAQVRARDGSVADALGRLSEFDATDVVLITMAVVIGTIVTQAFEFEAIRWLEGYWGTARPLTWLATLGCRWQMRRRNGLSKRRERLRKNAMDEARDDLSDKFDATTVAALEALVRGRPPNATDDVIALAKSIPWREASNPHVVRKVDDLTVRLRSYPPADHRVLPTRLGNILRAHEDRASASSAENVEAFVLRRFESLPPALQHEHDQYRTRLDLYCSMVLVSLVSGALGLILLWEFGWGHRLTTAAVVLGAVTLSWRGAIATATGYGMVLETIASKIPVPGSPTPPGGASSPAEP